MFTESTNKAAAAAADESQQSQRLTDNIKISASRNKQ